MCRFRAMWHVAIQCSFTDPPNRLSKARKKRRGVPWTMTRGIGWVRVWAGPTTLASRSTLDDLSKIRLELICDPFGDDTRMLMSIDWSRSVNVSPPGARSLEWSSCSVRETDIIDGGRSGAAVGHGIVGEGRLQWDVRLSWAWTMGSLPLSGCR